MIPKVRAWLDTQGYLLEMRTASAFRAAGFDVRQSSHYVDPETGKSREVDVIALDPDVVGIINISFIVECKSSNKPWVLLCSPDTLDGYNRIFAFSVVSDKARKALAGRMSQLLDRIPWLRKSGLIGYSVRQALSDADIAYAAAVSAAKACDVLTHGVASSYKPYAFAFPVIVIGGPLIRCSLAENGDVQLEEVEEGEFLFAAYLPKYFGTCIRVVTSARLTAFAVEAKRVADHIRAEFKSEEDEVRESWRDDVVGSKNQP